jgi:hypothetical protein
VGSKKVHTILVIMPVAPPTNGPPTKLAITVPKVSSQIGHLRKEVSIQQAVLITKQSSINKRILGLNSFLNSLRVKVWYKLSQKPPRFLLII